MAHENSHDDHGHDNTEGSRQYYPKGWYLPLVGLFVVAFAFAAGAGAIIGITGTDKWGKKEECCDMEKCKDGEHAKCDDKNCDHKNCGDHKDGMGATDSHHNNDSVNIAVAPPTSDCVKVDSAKVEPAHK